MLLNNYSCTVFYTTVIYDITIYKNKAHFNDVIFPPLDVKDIFVLPVMYHISLVYMHDLSWIKDRIVQKNIVSWINSFLE